MTEICGEIFATLLPIFFSEKQYNCGVAKKVLMEALRFLPLTTTAFQTHFGIVCFGSLGRWSNCMGPLFLAGLKSPPLDLVLLAILSAFLPWFGLPIPEISTARCEPQVQNTAMRLIQFMPLG